MNVLHGAFCHDLKMQRMKNPFIDENAQPSFVSLSPLEKDAQQNFHGEVELTLCLSPT